MPTLSVVVTAHNSQDFLPDCLASVAFADEIIVIDNESTDKTVVIAKEMGAKVFHHKNNPAHLNESKNFGFSKAKGDWILNLDPDERVEPELATEIDELLVHPEIKTNGFSIPRKNIIFGKWIEHGLWYPDYQIRLFKRGKGKFPDVHNHELLTVKGEVSPLRYHLIHHNYQTISQYLQKIDTTYSINEVEVFLKQKKQIQPIDALRFPLQDFLSNYFARQGYKDGLHGLVLALLQGFYMFIVFAKVWEKQGFKQHDLTLTQTKDEFDYFIRQLNFWYYLEESKQSSGIKKLVHKAKSKLHA